MDKLILGGCRRACWIFGQPASFQKQGNDYLRMHSICIENENSLLGRKVNFINILCARFSYEIE